MKDGKALLTKALIFLSLLPITDGVLGYQNLVTTSSFQPPWAPGIKLRSWSLGAGNINLLRHLNVPDMLLYKLPAQPQRCLGYHPGGSLQNSYPSDKGGTHVVMLWPNLKYEEVLWPTL